MFNYDKVVDDLGKAYALEGGNIQRIKMILYLVYRQNAGGMGSGLLREFNHKFDSSHTPSSLARLVWESLSSATSTPMDVVQGFDLEGYKSSELPKVALMAGVDMPNIAYCENCQKWFLADIVSEGHMGIALCERCENTQKECESCGELVPGSLAEKVGEHNWCPTCVEDDAVRCDYCGCLSHSDEVVRTVDGTPFCQTCAPIYVSTCDDCGDRHSGGSLRVTTEGDRICSSCFDENYVECDGCNAALRVGDIHSTVGINTYCHSCADDVAECPFCGDVFMTEEGCDCSEEYEMHGWSYKPEPVFNGYGNRYLGVELEVESGSDVTTQEVMSHIRLTGIGEDDLYFKSDGSLDRGVELVTHPSTYEYHKEHFGWGEILKSMRSLGCTSHDAETCGIHVHLNREGFGSTREAQRSGIGKVLWFVEAFWDNIVEFTRRSDYHIERWADRLGLDVSDYTPEDVFDEAEYDDERYRAVNITNSATIELRIFRGSLIESTFMAAVKFADLMFKIAELSTYELYDLTWEDFMLMGADDEFWVEYLVGRGIASENLFEQEDTIIIEEGQTTEVVEDTEDIEIA